MKKIISILIITMSTMAHASWWGRLSTGERAGIIGGTMLLMNSGYQGSELQHQRDLERIDTEIRRDYERKAVIENAHRKYRNNVGVPARLQSLDYYGGEIYHKASGQRGKVIYNNGQKQIIRLDNGMNVIVE